MRMAALSRATGVPVPTIKFYLREGLLPAGERTSPNQSQYDDSHVHRLHLIRGLTEIGGLSLATIAEIVRAVDNPALPLHEVFGIVQRAVTRHFSEQPGTPVEQSTDIIDVVMRGQGWDHPNNADHRRSAAALVATMHRLNLNHTVQSLQAYAAAAQIIAEVDMTGLAQHRSRDEMAESVATGTVLGDALLATFRRMAQAAMSAKRYNHNHAETAPPAGPPAETAGH